MDPGAFKSVVLMGTEPGNYSIRHENTGEKSQVTYLPGGSAHHHVVVLDLLPGTRYYYKCGDDSDMTLMSKEFSFVTEPEDISKTSFTVAVWGDMGQGECSNGTRTQLAKKYGEYDWAWHLGDIAYQDDWLFFDKAAYEGVLDDYMASMEFITATKPYMVLPGNHEVDCHSMFCILDSTYRNALRNFTAYNARWRMPSEETGGVMNMWYSFNYGPAHFVSMDAETDFPGAYENVHDEFFLLDSGHFNPTPNAYLEWLERDLRGVNRTQRPWLIAAGHRPMYLYENATVLRAAVEDLLVKYDVDLYLSGHIHRYYRTYPARDGQCVKGYTAEDREGRVVNIVTGGPGAIDRPMMGLGAAWTKAKGWLAGGGWGTGGVDQDLVAKETTEKSFGLLSVMNATAIRWELVSGVTGDTIDELVLTK